jgi:hypothetical protein
MRSDVPCFPSITACDEILQERGTQGFDGGGEVLYTYSSIFQPPIHKVRMLPGPPLPDEICHQVCAFVEECGGRGQNSQYMRQFSAY